MCTRLQGTWAVSVHSGNAWGNCTRVVVGCVFTIWSRELTVLCGKENMDVPLRWQVGALRSKCRHVGSALCRKHCLLFQRAIREKRNHAWPLVQLEVPDSKKKSNAMLHSFCIFACMKKSGLITLLPAHSRYSEAVFSRLDVYLDGALACDCYVI